MNEYTSCAWDKNCDVCKGIGGYIIQVPMSLQPEVKECWKCYKDYSKDPSGLEIERL